MDSFEHKLACLDKKVDSLVSKQDAVELKLSASEQKIDSELKMLAGVHVKLDMLPHTKANKKSDVDIPLKLPSESVDDVRKLLLTIKNDINVAEALVIFFF